MTHSHAPVSVYLDTLSAPVQHRFTMHARSYHACVHDLSDISAHRGRRIVVCRTTHPHIKQWEQHTRVGTIDCLYTVDDDVTRHELDPCLRDFDATLRDLQFPPHARVLTLWHVGQPCGTTTLAHALTQYWGQHGPRRSALLYEQANTEQAHSHHRETNQTPMVRSRDDELYPPCIWNVLDSHSSAPYESRLCEALMRAAHTLILDTPPTAYESMPTSVLHPIAAPPPPPPHFLCVIGPDAPATMPQQLTHIRDTYAGNVALIGGYTTPPTHVRDRAYAWGLPLITHIRDHRSIRERQRCGLDFRAHRHPLYPTCQVISRWCTNDGTSPLRHRTITQEI